MFMRDSMMHAHSTKSLWKFRNRVEIVVSRQYAPRGKFHVSPMVQLYGDGAAQCRERSPLKPRLRATAATLVGRNPKREILVAKFRRGAATRLAAGRATSA